MRRAFSMLVAIFTIVILSLVASYIFYTSSNITKVGSLQYKKEQAILLARSYTEYAVMAISANDRENTNSCLEYINATIGPNPANGEGYRVRVVITYIGNERYIKNCTRKAAELQNSDIDTLSAIIDVYVEYKDILNASVHNGFNALVPWQTYHKRSLQKI